MKGVFFMVETKNSMDFFMGALSPAGGFRGYFHHLDQQPDLWMYLIKAGPGCGKSTMMKRLAERSGQYVERLHCSSDPDSLDGVIFPKNNAAIIDATAPHIVEPNYPGAKQTVVSLFDTLDDQILKEHSTEIIQLFDRCSELQKSANRCISSASLLLHEQQMIALSALDHKKLSGYTEHLAQRLLPSTGKTGKEHLRLLSAVTPKGVVCYRNSIVAAADKIIVFEDEQGAAAQKAISILRNAALQAGYEIYTCLCPLSQSETAEHLLIPSLGLAFVTSNRWHPMQFEQQQTVHCSRFSDKSALACHKNRLRLSRQTVEELLRQTSEYQRQAKSTHDQLEAFYRSAADFGKVEKITQQVAEKIGF